MKKYKGHCIPRVTVQMARRKKTAQQEENVALGPQVPEGEEVFGVCHIFASFNDTFVHVTDLSGRCVCVYLMFCFLFMSNLLAK